MIEEIVDIKGDEQLFPFKSTCRRLHSETTAPGFYTISGLNMFRMKSVTYRFERKGHSNNSESEETLENSIGSYSSERLKTFSTEKQFDSDKDIEDKNSDWVKVTESKDANKIDRHFHVRDNINKSVHVECYKSSGTLKNQKSVVVNCKEMEKVNKQNNEQTGGFVRTIQNTSAKQIHSESKDKCVPGKHVIRKERILINEPSTKELCKDLSHGKTDVLAKFQDEEKVLKKEVHKDRKDVVERCLAESHNTIKMKSTTQRQYSEKKKK